MGFFSIHLRSQWYYPEHCVEEDSETTFELTRRMLNADFLRAGTFPDFYTLVFLMLGSVLW